MAVRFRCPSCDELVAAYRKLDETVECRRCRATVAVPNEARNETRAERSQALEEAIAAQERLIEDVRPEANECLQRLQKLEQGHRSFADIERRDSDLSVVQHLRDAEGRLAEAREELLIVSMLQIGEVLEQRTPRGTPWYSVEVSHGGLETRRTLRDVDQAALEVKIDDLAGSWEELWDRVSDIWRDTIPSVMVIEKPSELAAIRTEEAGDALRAVEETLAAALDVDHALDWDSFKDHSPFGTDKPEKPDVPPPPPEPDATDPQFAPVRGPLDWLLGSQRDKHRDAALARFAADHDAWQRRMQDYTQLVAQAKQDHNAAVQDVGRGEVAI